MSALTAQERQLMAAGWTQIGGQPIWTSPRDSRIWMERLYRRGWVLWTPGKCGRPGAFDRLFEEVR